MIKFDLTQIEKCVICGKENTTGYKEMVTSYSGIGEYNGCEDFCEECFNKNTFNNSYGFTFLKYKNKLFCYKPLHMLDFGFREILSDDDIKKAFNPEYYDFLQWSNK